MYGISAKEAMQNFYKSKTYDLLEIDKQKATEFSVAFCLSDAP